MPSVSQLPPLFYSVGVRIEALKERLNELPMGKFPTESGKKLVFLFLKGADRLKSLLDKRATEWLENIRDRESIQASVRRIGNSATDLFSYLEYIETFVFEKTRSEIIIPFELLIKEYFPQCQNDIFIFYPQWEYNFTYLDLKKGLRKALFLLTKEEDKKFFEDTKRIAMISFPALERDNILALVVLGHELAHYFDVDPDPVPDSDSDSSNNKISESPEVIDIVNKSIPKNKIDDWINECIELYPAPGSLPPLLADIYYKTRIRSELEYRIPFWLRELTADISAARFFGIGFYLAMNELLQLIVTPLSSPYPPNSKRLAEIAKEIYEKEYGFEFDVMKQIGKDLDEIGHDLVERVLKMMESELKSVSNTSARVKISKADIAKLTPEEKRNRLDRFTIDIIEDSIKPAMEVIRRKVGKKIPKDRCMHLTGNTLEACKYLRSHIPPAEKLGSQPIKKSDYFEIRVILNSVWFRWLELSNKFSVFVGEQSKFKDSLNNYYDEVAMLSRHALRAIELSSFVREHKLSEENCVNEIFVENKTLKEENLKIDKVGVLGKKEIVNLMLCDKIDDDKINDSLIIMPLLDPAQICEASVDLTLGNVFIVMKRARLPLLDFDKICRKNEPVDVYEFQEIVQLRPDGTIVLHPNEFVLGSTLEYISLPNDVMSYVIGKSSLGRVGLVIATATHVAPGFRGTITLELSNLGSVPLVLYPTMPIAQLVFHKLCSPVKIGYSLKGQYAYSTGPTFSKLLMRKRRT